MEKSRLEIEAEKWSWAFTDEQIARSGFIAGARALLEYAREKCFVDQTMTKYVSLSDLEAFCGEGE